MFAVEQYSFSKTDEYITLFHRYISRSIEALSARLGPELQQLSNETREQAWHLLDYGLKLTHGWEVVRTLLLALAPRMERDGFRHEWLPFLERGVAVCQRVQDVSGEAQLALYIGRLYRLRGEYAQAQAWFEGSAGYFQQVGDNHGRAQALNQLAYVARLQSDYARAKEYVDEALGLLAADDAERATSHWVLGTVAQSQLTWEVAEHHYHSALEIWQTQGDQQRIAWGMQNLGEALRGAEKYEEAAVFIQQAIVILGQLHDTVNQAIARMSLGIVYLNCNDVPQALALFTLAEGVLRQVGDQLHLGMVFNNIAMGERELGNLPAAERANLRAKYIWEILGETKYLVNTLDELGLTYQGQKRYAEAIDTYEHGLELLTELPSDPFIEMLREMLLPHLEEAQRVSAL